MAIDRHAELGLSFPGFPGYGRKTTTTVVNNYHQPPPGHSQAGQPSCYDQPPYWIVNPPPWITLPPPWMNMPPQGLPAQAPSAGTPTAPDMPPPFNPASEQPAAMPAPTWSERFFRRPAAPVPPPEIPVAIDPPPAAPSRMQRFREAFRFSENTNPNTPSAPDPQAMAAAVAETAHQEQVIQEEVQQLEQQTQAITMDQRRLDELLNQILARLNEISPPGANMPGGAPPPGTRTP